MRLQLAIRNLLRHRLRTLLSCLMVAFSVTGIIVFKGFSAYNIDMLARALGEQQFGHIQIATQDFWDRSTRAPEEKLLQNSEAIINELKKNPDVISASGRLSIYGLLNAGENSQATIITGFSPDTEPGLKKHLRVLSGEFFSGSDSREVLVGLPLAKSLNLKPGDDITLLCTTISGAFNGYDMKVAGVYITGVNEIDAHTLFTPLKTLQRFYDTEQLDLITVRGNDMYQSDDLLNKIFPVVEKKNLVAKPWHELSALYKQVIQFYNIQNGVIEIIIISLVLLGITNIVGMSIIERTGEIGTIRSLGETRGDLIKQFITESLVLGITGTLIGFLVAKIVAQILLTADLTMDIPGTSAPIPVQIYLVPSAFVYAFFVTQLATIVATLIPGARAARLNIVEALRKNI